MGMQQRFGSAIGLVALSVVLVSCGGVHRMMGTLEDLQKVQRDVGKALGGGEVRVQLNNDRVLSVGVMNSPLKTAPADQRKAKALELARIAYESYPSRSALKSVSVSFGTHRSYLGVFTYDESGDAFGFEASQLASEGRPEGQSR